MTEVIRKLKDVLASVLPVTAIVLLLHFTFVPIASGQMQRFIVGTLLVIIGLTIFLFGIDQSIEPIGHAIGQGMTRPGKIQIVVTVSLILGFFISYAEPDLHILANQVSQVTSGQFPAQLMVIVVSIGIGVMMTIGLSRILYVVPLKYVFLTAYGLIFILSLFSAPDFIAIAFDASGATTGAITVPFMLALAAGVSAMKQDSKSGEADAFGLVGISSAGAILGVLLTGIIMGIDKLSGDLPVEAVSDSGLLSVYTDKLSTIALETLISLAPILVAYFLFNIISVHERKRVILSNIRGLVITYVGLVLFLLGVNGGFMDIGSILGKGLASLDSHLPMLVISFVLGLVTVLAEPAVYVLTHQVEDITGGYVRRPLVLVFLSVAVGSAILMSVVRILVPGISLWMYILPGFGAAVLLSFFVPDLFNGIAFDSGGVASGPMTATFSLAFVQGIAYAVPGADIVTDGFGMIAVVAMMPIIAVQILGMLYQHKTKKLSSKGKTKQK